MIDGTYKVRIDVLVGRRTGMIKLRTDGDVVFADINAPVVGRQRAKGRAEGDTFTLTGTKMIMLMGKVNYTMKGQVSGDNLSLDIQTNKGTLKLKGVRI